MEELGHLGLGRCCANPEPRTSTNEQRDMAVSVFPAPTLCALPGCTSSAHKTVQRPSSPHSLALSLLLSWPPSFPPPPSTQQAAALKNGSLPEFHSWKIIQANQLLVQKALYGIPDGNQSASGGWDPSWDRELSTLQGSSFRYWAALTLRNH